MKKLESSFQETRWIVILFTILAIIALATSYYGSIDITDYADVAKYFSGEYKADIRGSHSYLYGFVHSPFLKLFDNYLAFKISSLIWLGLIIFSVYLITNRSKKALWLISLCPVVWYMAPWINPIQLSALLLLWAFNFISKYEEENSLKNLFLSGLFIGLGWAFWDTILFFGGFLALVYMFNKKLSHSLILLVSILIGLLPRLILDLVIFNFPFYTIMKSFFGTLANISGGIYSLEEGHSSPTLVSVLLAILTIPIYFWKLYLPRNFSKMKKPVIFISLCLLLILNNLQLRYFLVLLPIMIVMSYKLMSYKQFKIQLSIFALVSLIFIAPYIMQLNNPGGNNIHGFEITNLLSGNLDPGSTANLISLDLDEITSSYPGETFLVGNSPDNYRKLAYLYWGKEVTEFVSLQDYNLYLAGTQNIYSKRFEPIPRIKERRQIWLEGGLDKGSNDPTDYEKIDYALSFNEPIDADRFSVVKKYRYLYLSKKLD